MKTPYSGLTKEAIVALLLEESPKGNFAIERALLVLLERQTADEQDSATTTYRNGVGFAGADAEFYTKLAIQVQESKAAYGKRLYFGQYKALRGFRKAEGGEFVKKGRGITKYAGQLLQEAEAKAAAKAA